MSGFYGISPRVRNAIRRALGTPLPDPYSARSADYAERHTSHVTELENGLVRVDVGEPIKRLPSETQPVRSHGPKAVPAPAPAETPTAAPVSVPSASREARKRGHRAITRKP